MHIDKEADAEQRRSRRKSTRAPIAASSIAALGARSGVSTKNDPEAERIVKRAMQEGENDRASFWREGYIRRRRRDCRSQNTN